MSTGVYACWHGGVEKSTQLVAWNPIFIFLACCIKSYRVYFLVNIFFKICLCVRQEREETEREYETMMEERIRIVQKSVKIKTKKKTRKRRQEEEEEDGE